MDNVTNTRPKGLSKGRVILWGTLVLVVGVAVGVWLTAVGFVGYSSVEIIDNEDRYGGYFAGGECNALVLPLNGYLTTYLPMTPDGVVGEEWADATASEDIVFNLEQMATDPAVGGVVLYIDSPGGDPVAGEEVANALKRFGKPSVAVIRGLGASAAYWAASGADQVYASRLSDVGGIGVTASYLDESQKVRDEGYRYTELSTGKFKDTGDPNRPLTAEERAIILADLGKVHEVFVQVVAANRGLATTAVAALANGLTYVGDDALAKGLIDGIGDLSTAREYLSEQMGEPAELCW